MVAQLAAGGGAVEKADSVVVGETALGMVGGLAMVAAEVRARAAEARWVEGLEAEKLVVVEVAMAVEGLVEGLGNGLEVPGVAVAKGVVVETVVGLEGWGVVMAGHSNGMNKRIHTRARRHPRFANARRC